MEIDQTQLETIVMTLAVSLALNLYFIIRKFWGDPESDSDSGEKPRKPFVHN